MDLREILAQRRMHRVFFPDRGDESEIGRRFEDDRGWIAAAPTSCSVCRPTSSRSGSR
jgi:hypothetical protein